MPALWRKHRNYIWLLPLCAAALLYQVLYSFVAINTSLQHSSLVDPAFSSTDGTAEHVSKEAQAAGLHEGDRVLSVGGKPVNNVRELMDDMERRKPGEFLTITEAPRGEGTVRTVTIPLAGAAGVGGFLFATGIAVIMLGCVAMGVYIALRQPHDLRALFAFSLIVSLAQVITLVDWYRLPEPFWAFADVWRLACVLNWSVAIFGFGLYFPERFKWDKERPWLKWLYLGPLLLFNTFLLLTGVLPAFSFNDYRRVEFVAGPLARLPFFLITISICFFFAFMGARLGTAGKSDAKRRLRLLQVGAAIGLGPIGLLLLAQLFGRGLPDTLVFAACLLFVVFPVTLAYVVLTERAMHLSVVIRQGFRYAIAKGGLRLLMIIVLSLLFWRLSVYMSQPQFNDVTRVIVLGGTIGLAVLVVRRVRAQLFTAIDKKFFRDHYKSEAVLSELSDNVRTIVDEKQLFETVTQCVSAALHVSHSCVMLNSEGLLRPVFASGLAIAERAELSEDAKAVTLVAESKEPPPIYFDRADNWVHTTPENELVTLKGLGAQLLLPLKAKDKLLGLLCLGPKLSEEPFTKTDMNLLRSVAVQTGLALENSRLTATIAQEVAKRERLNREIEIAREVQERLFPQQLPVVAGIDYCGACRPALGVGGDYYDFLELPNGELGVAIGDVSGKGIAAALLMASLQASLRGQALAGTTDLAHLMSNVNKLVFDATPVNRYATFFYGQYEQRSRTFRYVNAGHNAPFILRRTDDETTHIIRLETGGPVVGLFRQAPYQQGSLTLKPGDVFVGFTDGISEAMNREEEEWGEEHLIPAAAAHLDKAASEMIPQLMSDADRFVNGAPQHDDMTLVVVKLHG